MAHTGAYTIEVKKSSARKWVALTLALGLLAAAVFWFTRPPEVQDKLREDAARLREEAARMVDDATRGTPLAGSGNILRTAPTPPPATVMHPSTNPGTLAGPVIRGESGVEGMLLPDGSFRKGGQSVVNRVLEDPKLKKDFVEDLAEYIVSGFAPDVHGGRFTRGLQSLNQHCGTRMNTATGGGRSALMRYVFQPTMLRGLYHLYLHSFLETLQDRARLRCSSKELEQFYALFSSRIDDTARALTAILDQSDLSEQLSSYEKLAEACEAVSAKSTVALFDLDKLSEEEASQGELQMMQQHVEDLNQEYKNALEKRDQALRHLMERLHTSAGTAFDDDSLLFLSLWVNRRLSAGGNAREAVGTSIEILEDLAERVRDLALGRLPGDYSAALDPSQEEQRARQESTNSPAASLVDDSQLSPETASAQRQRDEVSQVRPHTNTSAPQEPAEKNVQEQKPVRGSDGVAAAARARREDEKESAKRHPVGEGTGRMEAAKEDSTGSLVQKEEKKEQGDQKPKERVAVPGAAEISPRNGGDAADQGKRENGSVPGERQVQNAKESRRTLSEEKSSPSPSTIAPALQEKARDERGVRREAEIPSGNGGNAADQGKMENGSVPGERQVQNVKESRRTLSEEKPSPSPSATNRTSQAKASDESEVKPEPSPSTHPESGRAQKEPGTRASDQPKGTQEVLIPEEKGDPPVEDGLPQTIQIPISLLVSGVWA